MAKQGGGPLAPHTILAALRCNAVVQISMASFKLSQTFERWCADWNWSRYQQSPPPTIHFGMLPPISAGDVTWAIPQVMSPAEILMMAIDVISG